MPRTGDVTIMDFDKGALALIGAALVQAPIDTQKYYWVEIPGIEYQKRVSGIVRTGIYPPEQVIRKYILPSIVIRRGNPAQAMERWHSEGATQYRIASPGAEELDGGFSGYESKPQATPFDIPYDFMILSRYTTDGLVMWQHIMDRFAEESKDVTRPRFPVVDSEGARRTYTAVAQDYSIVGETGDVLRRVMTHTIGLRVMGELDFLPPTRKKAITGGVEFTFDQT